MPSFVATACAEFPNDNSLLHRGAIWRCEGLIGLAGFEAPVEVAGLAPESRTEREAPAELDGAEPDEEPGIEVVDEMTFEDIIDEEAPADAAGPSPPASRDAFATLVEMLEGAAQAAGAEAHAIGALRALVGVARVGPDSFTTERAAALVAAGLLEETARGLSRSEALTGQVQAWQKVLREESDDLSACGPASLDEWCARLLGHALGPAVRVDVLRRDLRRRGVAAFGLVEVAA